jgi:hypothetical protein
MTARIVFSYSYAEKAEFITSHPGRFQPVTRPLTKRREIEPADTHSRVLVP